jgi:threonine/homoserine/homoserine lactone efflux protein
MVAFLITCIIVEITPGPNMATLAVLTLARGLRAGLIAVAGVALGLAVIGALVVVGLGTILTQVPALYALLRWAGFAYLLWLAWEIWTDRGAEPGGFDAEANAAGLFGRGFLTNVLNPKAAVFYVAVLPTFIPEGDPQAIAVLSAVYAGIYVAVATAIHTAIVFGAARMQGILARSAGIARVRRVLAVLLVAVALWLLWSTRV